MSDHDSEADSAVLAAEAAKMTDEELLDSWETASEKETENLSPFLRSIVDEMESRDIAFR
ncbi:hypothetical protein ASE00_16375 [Sphingomonas sp. Root710]|uniref:hypothetical protein n=1 Tax=Sphingomonas sp. Root710 TaxID=1736594 RepID=UPI0006F5D493|nr:hypothetical protein [Sphingomonas sp. Root710]KRB80622.1 hypothetical protein ASE00_16375 [Sphingomonas sp. Root710]